MARKATVKPKVVKPAVVKTPVVKTGVVKTGAAAKIVEPLQIVPLAAEGPISPISIEPHHLETKRGFVSFVNALTVTLPADVEAATITGFQLTGAGKLAARGVILMDKPFELTRPYTLSLAAGALKWRMA